jgi:hypothetical protein
MAPAVERVLQFAVVYQWWLYGLLGLLLLFYLRRAIVARQESLRSIFKLEQEQARARYSRSVVVMMVLLAVAAIVFGLTNFLGPALSRPPEPTPKATGGPLSEPTLTPTPPPPTITPTPTATKPLPTRLVPPTPTSLAVTPTPLVRPPACADPNARLTSPGVNQAVRGSVPVRGTANIADFQYYKVEVAAGAEPGDQVWTVVGALHYTPLDGGVLETFNSDAYPPGIYTLRLVVVNKTGNYPEPCRVTVTVQR